MNPWSRISEFWPLRFNKKQNNNIMIFHNQFRHITISVRRNSTYEWFEKREITYLDLATVNKWKDLEDDIIADDDINIAMPMKYLWYEKSQML